MIEKYERRQSEALFIKEFEKWPMETLAVQRDKEFGFMKPGDVKTIYIGGAEIKYDSLDALQEAGWIIC